MLMVIGVLALVGLLIRMLFEAEVKACFERDPAARNVVEVIFTYPGLHALIFHRAAPPPAE